MTGKQIERLVRHQLLRGLPGWEVKKNKLFMKPIGMCLCGVALGTSSFDAELVYADAFVRPLYLPPEEHSANLIRRLHRRGGSRLGTDPGQIQNLFCAIREQATPFVLTYQSPSKLVAALARTSNDPYQLQAVALSHVLLGDRAASRQSVTKAVGGLMKDGRKWCADMADGLRALDRRIEAEFDLLRGDLFKWREDRLASLGLVACSASSSELARESARDGAV